LKDVVLAAPSQPDAVKTSASSLGPSLRRPVKSAFERYGAALCFVALSLGVTLLLQHLFPYPFLFLFFGAVMASAWFGGMGAGLFAVLISTLAVDYFFVPPYYSFAIKTTEEAYFAAFVICALVASWASSSKKRSEVALLETRDHLEMRVAERTAELEESNSELRRREHQLHLVTETIPQQLWSSTADGSIDYCNQRLLNYVGRTVDQMKGEAFLETIHPDDRENFRRLWQHALSSGQPFEGEWRVRGADGQYRWFFTRGVPLRDQEQKTLRWYGTNTDIEDLHKTEEALMRTQSELAYLSRVLSMGELAASIAHEINQPLAAVVAHGHASLGWLSANPPNVGKALQTTERIIQDGTRAGAVLGRIRALFKREAPAQEWVDMNEVIHELASSLRGEAKRRRISIKTALAFRLPKIRGDRVQLQQVVLNLMMNGMDAIGAATGRNRELLVTSAKEDSNTIVIRVEDCGIGITPDMTEKIFEPFFTTKPQGIGMGLAISRSIVESHQGRLWAAPRPSGGATFQFTIPISVQDSNG
jgi:PAS domain S-box-containing protein